MTGGPVDSTRRSWTPLLWCEFIDPPLFTKKVLLPPTASLWWLIPKLVFRPSGSVMVCFGMLPDNRQAALDAQSPLTLPQGLWWSKLIVQRSPFCLRIRRPSKSPGFSTSSLSGNDSFGGFSYPSFFERASAKTVVPSLSS